MFRSDFLKVAGLSLMMLFIFQAFGNPSKNQNQPNILIMIGDDVTYNDLPLYGGKNIKTPNIDNFAAQGLAFNKAYLTMAMCAPCRAELYTGMYPARNGVCWNHCGARREIRSIVQYLGDLNYRIGLAGKVHVSPRTVYPFEMVEGLERKCAIPSADYNNAGLQEFMQRDKDQPFCLVVGLVVPHAPWTEGDPSHFNPKELKLPPYLADTDETRQDFAKYLAEIEVLDQHVGLTLQALEKSGQAENTLVIFTSEQGSQFPSCKWTSWNTGVHTAFVVRWPGQVKAGKRVDAIIQYADVLPTLIEVAGGRINANNFDGSSFLPVLRGKSERHRKYAYFMHNNIPEGPPYPIRAVTDGQYHYIRNLSPEELYIEKHVMGKMKWHEYWPSWVFNSTHDEHTYMVTKRYMKRPAEQLYNMDNDPNNMTNLANDPEMAEIKIKLSRKLDSWMQQQSDPGATLDTWEIYNAAKKGNHFKRK